MRAAVGRRRLGVGLLAAVGLCAGACAGPSMFAIGGRDSDGRELERVLSAQGQYEAPDVPMVIVAIGGSQPHIVGYELSARRQRWSVPGTPSTHFSIGGKLVVHGAGRDVVARSLADGKVLWRAPVAGDLLGVTTDGSAVYWVDKQGATYEIAAASRLDGSILWKRTTTSEVGAPAARGGQVFVPLMRQWLVILDGQSGKRLGRIRGVDHQIVFVRAGAEGVTFGSNAGVYRLDEHAAPATAASSWFATAKLPDVFADAQYDYDDYQPVQSAFTAFDRNHRLLWAPSKVRKPGFEGGIVIAHSFRYLFGLDAKTGDVRWAYLHPRVDLMASSDNGNVVGVVSQSGQIGAIDPANGVLRYLASLDGVGNDAPVVGATFAAAGWAPHEEVSEIHTPNTTRALTNIARDKDSRFVTLKKFALRALAEREGKEAVDDLLDVIISGDGMAQVTRSAEQALIARRDPTAVPKVLDLLEIHDDVAAGTVARGVGAFARLLAALDPAAIEPAQRERATRLLIDHLEDPATSGQDLVDLIAALDHIGTGAERAAFRRILLVHHAEPPADAASALEEVCVVLARTPGPDRAAVQWVAQDTATGATLAKAAHDALARPVPEPPAPAPSAPSP